MMLGCIAASCLHPSLRSMTSYGRRICRRDSSYNEPAALATRVMACTHAISIAVPRMLSVLLSPIACASLRTTSCLLSRAHWPSPFASTSFQRRRLLLSLTHALPQLHPSLQPNSHFSHSPGHLHMPSFRLSPQMLGFNLHSPACSWLPPSC
jgi:hypothetical protein